MVPSRWPRWTAIVIGLALAVATIVLVFLVEPVAQAVAPSKIEPTPTLVHISYARPLSHGCENCHFDREALEASAEPETDVEAAFIEPWSLATPHGRLGCVTCHRGNGLTDDKDAAHEGLIADPTAEKPWECVICHHDLPEVLPEDRLNTPHGRVVEAIMAGSPCEVYCSDCHGGVGHGFDPVSGNIICSMSVCRDCHEERELNIEMTKCETCHLGPHDVAEVLSCEDCHASTDAWAEIETDVHPSDLLGKHAEISCFDCHAWPNFKDLTDYECVDCHERPHERPEDDDCARCHEDGGDWTVINEEGIDHTEYWDYHVGKHAEVKCIGCHFEGYEDTSADCAGCHTPNKETCDLEKECTDCHLSDKAWSDLHR